MSEELKPCPFCGSTELSTKVNYNDEEDFATAEKQYFVQCTLCGSATRLCSRYDIAKDIWNTRAEEQFANNSKKTQDQTIKADAGKAQIHLVPPQIVFDIAEVREYGNRKYGDPDNWKTVEPERYIDAAGRHYWAMVRDPYGKDEESGIEHYKHLACNLAFLCEMLKGGRKEAEEGGDDEED